MYCNINDGNILLVAVYVDDLLIVSNNGSWEKNLKKQVTKRFKMQDLGLAKKVLGLRVTRANGVVMLDQEQ